MVSPELGGELTEGAEGFMAIEQLNSMLAYASKPRNNCLSHESALRLIELQSTAQNPWIAPETVNILQANLEKYSKDLPIIPALRTIEDFPIGSNVHYVPQYSGDKTFIETKVVSHGYLGQQFVVLKLGQVDVLINPGYAGLLDDREYGFALSPHTNFEYRSPYTFNLRFTEVMAEAGLGGFIDHSLLTALARKHKDRRQTGQKA